MVRPPLLPQRTSFRPFWEKITSPLTVQASVPAAAPVPPQVEVAVSKTAFESLTLERERGQMLRATMLGYPAAYWGSRRSGVPRGQRQPKTRATTCPVFRGWAGGLPSRHPRPSGTPTWCRMCTTSTPSSMPSTESTLTLATPPNILPDTPTW